MSRSRVLKLSIALIFLAISYIGTRIPGTSIAKENPAVATSTTATTSTQVAGTYPVVRVVDGDTIVLRMDSKDVKVRLIGLDTPEVVDPRKPVQCFGREASAKAKQLLEGQSVRIETDASQGAYDKYGRLLAYIFLSDGTLFNKYMIAEGYGHEYTYRLPYTYQTEFKEAARSAREQKKGLWADGVCS